MILEWQGHTAPKYLFNGHVKKKVTNNLAKMIEADLKEQKMA